MELDFRKLRRSEILQAAELAARSFDDYEYFTNWFPEKESRNRFLRSVISHEYRTNYGRADYLVGTVDGKEVFDEREIDYNGKTMGSWSLKKTM